MISFKGMKRTLAVLAAGTMISATGAQAAPTTYTFTGALDASYAMYGSNAYAGLFNTGDQFTLTVQFDRGQTPDNQYNYGDHSLKQWFTGSVQTMFINGHTFTVGDSVTGFDYRHVESYEGNYETMRLFSNDTTVGAGGGATSSMAGVDHIAIEWYLYSPGGMDDLLNLADPEFPTTIDLSDWAQAYVLLQINDYETGSNAYFVDNVQPVFTGVTAFGAPESVPAPGALALLGLGLFGIGAIRRKAKAA